MRIENEVVRILEEVLGLQGRAESMTAEAPLMGAIPELDSMAVLAILTSVEEHFRISIEVDEIDASVFDTVGSLTDFVSSKVAA